MIAQRILIVEDDPKSLKLMCEILKHEKYEICAATDGYQALSVALDKRPDLMILDINLPCGDGLTVHERMGRNANLCTTPVIYVTADPSPKVKAAGKRLGAAAVLAKPFDRVQLLAAISSALHAVPASPIAELAGPRPRRNTRKDIHENPHC
jgi:DNA-binding response OmpR family regulator